jgi:sigma-E factor negative regulatory protein RseC
MIEETARVVAIEGDQVKLIVDRQSACGQCARGSGCGTSLLTGWLNRRQVIVSLPNDADAKPGDMVVLGVRERSIQRGAMMLYATPLAGLLVGGVIGQEYGPNIGVSAELGSIFLGLFGTMATLLWIRQRSLRPDNERRPDVRILRKMLATERPTEISIGTGSLRAKH